MEEKDDFTFSIEGKDYTISEKKNMPEKSNKQTLHAPSLGIGAIIAGICSITPGPVTTILGNIIERAGLERICPYQNRGLRCICST